MKNNVLVYFEGQNKTINYTNQLENINLGDFVITETLRGLELGKVIQILPFEDEKTNILRKATEQDLQTYENNKILAKGYIEKTKKIVKELKLDMKITNAELTIDNNKIIISFTAESRVDFRELVKKLAGMFKLKIELRQISSRDDLKMHKGIGSCGRQCCCSSFLPEYKNNSIKMAKIQNMALNPNNINGVCGKLKCCLDYEYQTYVDNSSEMPKVGSEIKTPDGMGKVLYNNILKKTVQVKLEDGYKEYSIEELKNNE